MNYWSRWTNNAAIAAHSAGEFRERRSNERNKGYVQGMLRETRPVVVVVRTQEKERLTSQPSQRGQERERETSSGISLEVKRSRSYTSASYNQRMVHWQHEVTTQPIHTE